MWTGQSFAFFSLSPQGFGLGKVLSMAPSSAESDAIAQIARLLVEYAEDSLPAPTSSSL